MKIIWTELTVHVTAVDNYPVRSVPECCRLVLQC